MKNKKFTYSSRDVIDVSWALFCVLIIQCFIHCLCHPFLSVHLVVPCPCCFGCVVLLSVLVPVVALWWLSLLSVIVLIVRCCLVVVPTVVVAVVYPLVISVGVILFCCFCHCGFASFLSLHPCLCHASCLFPPHEQLFVAVAWVWVCHLGAISW